MDIPYAVELCGISKKYYGSEKNANTNISLGLRKGEILCIAGENGAGKTTLMKILGGLETPDSGAIFINGNAVTIDSPLDARKLKIGMVHQHFMLFPEYTVAENITMGMEPQKWKIFTDKKKAHTEANSIITSHHFSINPDSIVQNLSVSEMQQTEICRLLYQNADIIILDEPTSILTEHETNAFFKTLKNLQVEGKSIFLITHKLPEIKSIADRVAVLRRGELIGILEKDKIDEFAISRMMINNDTDYPAAYSVPGSEASARLCKNSLKEKPIIEFNNVTVLRRGQQRPLLNKISFTVSGGEILGFAGVSGNGLGVLEAVLGGFLHPASGTITHNSREISGMNIRRLRNQGLAYIPANRLRVGSAPNASIEENLIINRRHELTRYAFLNHKAINNFTARLIKRYDIKIPAMDSAAKTLSGGNLQKLILAREIDLFRDYFVFSEPAWGLDIGASKLIWDEIAGLREKGAAIILISTNLDEILTLSDRIMVMYKGNAAAVLQNVIHDDKIALREKIANYMQGLI